MVDIPQKFNESDAKYAKRLLPYRDAEIARLRAEVAELKLQLGICDHSLHADWNDAIEAVATVKTEDGYELVSRVTAAAIRALKRTQGHT